MYEKNIADPLKDIRSSFQGLQKQLNYSFKLPKFTTKSDLTGLKAVSKELKDPFGLKEVIGKAPLAEFSKISKQLAGLGKFQNLIPELSNKSILTISLSLNFPNIIVSRPVDNSIFPLVPEEHHTSPPNSDSTTLTDRVYEERSPSEQQSDPVAKYRSYENKL